MVWNLLATCSAIIIIAGQGVVGRANLYMHDGKDAARYETCLPHAAPSLLAKANTASHDHDHQRTVEP